MSNTMREQPRRLRPLPRLIGVTGQARHGKDTISKLLVEGGFHRVALADNVKKLALIIDPIVRPGVDGSRLSDVLAGNEQSPGGWEAVKQLPEVRRLLQGLGGGVREVVGRGAWIEALIESANLEDNFYVISDIRYANEAQWVDAMGGEVWKVERPNFDNGLGDMALHGSEAEVIDIFADLTIRNDGTLEELETKVRKYVQQRRYA